MKGFTEKYVSSTDLSILHMQGANATDNMLTGCGNTTSTERHIDPCPGKNLNHVSKQLSNNNIVMPQLQSLTQIRPHQGMLQQPLVQISGLQVPQQVLQHQFLKSGQPAHVSSFLPAASLPNIFSALHYQFLVQALQGLNSLPPTSQAFSVMNSDYGTANASAAHFSSQKSNASLSDNSFASKVNGTFIPCNKDNLMLLSTINSTTSENITAQKSPSMQSIASVFKKPICSSIEMSNSGRNPKKSERCTILPSINDTAETSDERRAPDHLVHESEPLLMPLHGDLPSKQNRVPLKKSNSDDASKSMSHMLQERITSTSEVLTHVIEGHVIREGPRPFPVERSMHINEFLDSENEDSTEITDEDDLLDDVEPTGFKSKGHLNVTSSNETKQCHCCGMFFHPKMSVSRTGKFCSVTCSKRTAACSRWMIHYASKGLLNEKNKHKRVGISTIKKSRNDETDDERSAGNESNGGKEVSNLRKPKSSSQMSPFSECTKAGQLSNTDYRHFAKKGETLQKSIERGSSDLSNVERTPDCDASSWGVSEVCEFILSLSGCASYAEDFKKQEIDGQALLLLTEEHLMSTMNIKLGPALKICSNIRALRGFCTSGKNNPS